MAEIKSHEFERLAARAHEKYRIFLIYGPDRGLVSERATEIAKATGIDLNDPFSMVTLDAGDLHGDAGRLLDEVDSIGLFGGEKLVRVRGAAAEKALVDALQILAGRPSGGSYVVIEAGDIKKGTGLRKIAEPSSVIAVIPCYADDQKALNALIDRELGEEGMRISPGARQALLEQMGGDRLASRNELRKLILYCRGTKSIEEEDVAAIIGDASAISVDDAVDAILGGDRNSFHHAMQKIASSKTPVFLVLQSCLRQFQLLDQMKAEMEERGLQAAQVMQTLGRHIHFRRKPVIEKALRTWPSAAIAREMNRLQSAVLQGRQRPALEEEAALLTLLWTTIQSGRAA